ncbi:MAG: gamma-glutamylcyclotransferase [Janthinobacterium lividum]
MVLTRDMLADGGMLRMIAESSPTLTVLTEAERAASLAATLARRPAGAAPVWLFAYGSLIWNPALHYTHRRLARIHGWHRSFCLSTVAGRGTPEAPGLVLGLDRGGACTGAAFSIDEAVLEQELTLLWQREMLSGSYEPRWLAVRGGDGAVFGHAITFTIRRDGQYYARLEREELVRRLATAAGALGSSADYLFKTRDSLREMGITDRAVEALSLAVQALREPAAP